MYIMFNPNVHSLQPSLIWLKMGSVTSKERKIHDNVFAHELRFISQCGSVDFYGEGKGGVLLFILLLFNEDSVS